MTPEEELEWVVQQLRLAAWRFAKTMPENPHHYTLLKTWGNPEDFYEVIQLIRKHGTKELYEGRMYTVLNIDGMKYWTMGYPVKMTTLINRKVLPEGATC